jgi:predicted RNA-binding Zn-ribbon protein involved in translation (DUF1610 family)
MKMSDEISVKFACPNCGTDPSELSFTDDSVTDKSEATCKSCGVAFGTYGEIKSQAAKVITDKMMRQLAADFKKAGWKI